MNQVIQQVAANAEESASASEPLNAQSEQFKNLGEQLRAVVEGHDHVGKQELAELNNKIKLHPERKSVASIHYDPEIKLTSDF